MKKILVILTATITLALTNKAEAQVYGGISFNTFYKELSPYGRWVNNAQYGQVWIADAPGFEPYYDNGHWVFTSYGWTWVSDYAWGWAPFHYGRWTYLPTLGWAWVPGYEWGPAWVGWCQYNGYYGWAPLSPGLGFNFTYSSMPYNYWRFVPQQHIAGPSVRNHIIRANRNMNISRNVTIINNTQVNNNITYMAGPQREAVEKITRQKIETRPVAFTGTDERTKVEQKEVRMYRPDLKPAGTAGDNRMVNPIKKEQLEDGQQRKNPSDNVAVKPLLNTVMEPAKTVQPMVKQPVQQPVNREDDRRLIPAVPKKNNETVMDERRLIRLPNEREAIKQLQKDNELLRQNDLKQQRMEEMQVRAQQEQLKQQVREQQDQQRKNEIRQQQLNEQRTQQQRMMQQQNLQRQNEIRQQRMQDAMMRPERNTPVNPKPPSRKPRENY